MCLVNPYLHIRNELKRNNKGYVTEVCLISKRDLKKEYHVEDFYVGNPHYILHTDKEVEETWGQLKDLLRL